MTHVLGVCEYRSLYKHRMETLSYIPKVKNIELRTFKRPTVSYKIYIHRILRKQSENTGPADDIMIYIHITKI